MVVFLTDGMDSRLYGTKSVDEEWFQSLMAKVTNGNTPLTIHSVGFSRGTF